MTVAASKHHDFGNLSVIEDKDSVTIKQSRNRKQSEIVLIILKSALILFSISIVIALFWGDNFVDIYAEYFGSLRNEPQAWFWRDRPFSEQREMLVEDLGSYALSMIFFRPLDVVITLATVSAAIFCVLKLPSGFMILLRNRSIVFQDGAMIWAGKSYDLDEVEFSAQKRTRVFNGSGSISSSGHITIHSTGGAFEEQTGWLQLHHANGQLRRLPLWIGKGNEASPSLRKIQALAQQHRKKHKQ